jgi:hypothetical protein
MKMPDIIQSLKTKFELVAVCAALLGMMCTGAYVYSSQTSQLNNHEKQILAIENEARQQTASASALESVMNATIIPSINENKKELVRHETRLKSMEDNARVDRELLIEIRNDLKWMRTKLDP